MISNEEKDRARRLASRARGNIKSERLLSSGSRGWMKASLLADQPILKYLDAGEQPHYYFFNADKGVRIGSIQEKSMRKIIRYKYLNSMWVTDRGLHFTVGKSSGDFHYFLSYSSIQSVENRQSSFLSRRFVFDTSEGETRFTIDNPFDTDSAVEYIRRQISSSTTATSSSSAPSGSPSVSLTGDSTTSILQQMEPMEFEQLVAKVWEKQGWTTQVTGGSGDKGIDVIAVREDPFEQRQYIQAKCYADGNRVGSDAIQKYSGLYARNESVDAVVVVTTSGFTTEAQQVAENRNVKLVDGTRLSELVEQYNLV